MESGLSTTTLTTRRVPVVAVVVLLCLTAATVGALGSLATMKPLLAIAGVAVIGLSVAIVLFPDVATPLVVAIIYSNAAVIAVTLHGVPYVLGAAVVLLLTVPLINHLLRGGQLVVMPALPIMLLLLAAMILSTILSIDPRSAWSKTQTFAVEGVLLYFLLTNVVRSRAMLRTIIWVLIGVGAALGALSVYQQLTHSFNSDFLGFAQPTQAAFSSGTNALGEKIVQPRLGGVLGDDNYFAQIMLMIIPLGIFRVWSERSLRLRALALTCTLFIALGVVLTFSRGAVVGFGLMLVVMAVLRYISLKQIVGIVLVMALLLAAFPQYRHRLSSLGSVTGATAAEGSAGAADNSVRSRTTEGLAAALTFLNHPVVGVGPGLFASDYYEDYAAEVGTRAHAGPRGPHDLYVGMAAETGALGLLLFFAIVLVTLHGLASARRAVRSFDVEAANTVTAFMLGIVSYLTTGIFLGFAYERYFWLLLALAAAATVIARSSPPAVESGRARPSHPAMR